MKTFARCAALAGVLAFIHPAAADPIDDLRTVLDGCEASGDAACAAALWSFTDVTGDDRLTVAELTRLLRLMAEWAVIEQARDAALAAGLDPAAAPAQDSDRMGAVAAAFLGGPLAANLVVANFDYDGDGALARGEVFADMDEERFVQMVAAEARRLPEHAGMLFMRALEAQKQFETGGLAPSGPETIEREAAAPEAPAFELRDIQQSMSIEDGTVVVVITGKLENVSATVKPSPDIVAEFRDRSGRVLKSQTFKLARDQLEPGASVAFSERVVDAPRDLDNLVVFFKEGD